jgi:hypothetical protein
MKALLTKPRNDSLSLKNLSPPAPDWIDHVTPISDNVLSLQRKPNCACGGGCPRCGETYALQAKLEVSQPGDTLEQEADRVAEQVLRMPQPKHPDDPQAHESTGLRLSRYSSGSSAQRSPEVPPIVHDVARSPGEPLDPATRAFMEPRFGHDFSSVRVHSGAAAEQAAREVNASAYTLGNHLAFAAGRYAPGTREGDRLLAHELAHTIQQGASAPLANAQARTGRAPPALQRSAAPVIQREGPDTGAGGATGTTGTAGAVTAPDPCAEGIAETRTGALDWLDKAYAELLAYDVDEIYPPLEGSPPNPDQARRGRVLLRTFRTRDLDYVEVIRRRLLHIASSLRAGDVAISCAAPGNPHCRAAGSSFTAAYVERPFALVMCFVGTPGNRPVQTFVHELAHAVVPQVGISMKRGDATPGLRDRAYDHERLFRYMTPEEALDNAESYGLLVEQLATGADAEVATSQVDTARGCKDPGAVLAAMARLEQWNRDAGRWLQAMLIGTVALSELPQDERDKLAIHFPGVSSISGLQDLDKFYQRMDYALNISIDVACAKAGGNCTDSTLGFAPTGSVTASAAKLRKLKAKESINLCPNWFDASEDARVASMYALFILSRPDWMTSTIALAEVFHFAGLAGERHREITPAPATHSAREHLDAARKP